VLGDRDAVSTLFNEIAPLFKQRNGGYTRIIRLHKRHGDGAQMVLLELVEKPKVEPKAPKKAVKEAKAAPEEAKAAAPAKEEKPAAPKEEKPAEKKVEKKPKLEEKPKEKPEKKAEEKPEEKKGFLGGIRTLFKRNK